MGHEVDCETSISRAGRTSGAFIAMKLSAAMELPQSPDASMVLRISNGVWNSSSIAAYTGGALRERKCELGDFAKPQVVHVI